MSPCPSCGAHRRPGASPCPFCGAPPTSGVDSVARSLLGLVLFGSLTAGCQALYGVAPTDAPSTSAAELLVSPGALTFGDTPTDAAAAEVLVFESIGAEVVMIHTLAVADDVGFAVGLLDLPLRLEPGESEEVTVVFSPSGVGAAADTLEIGADHLAAPFAVPLDGTGVAP